MRHEHKQIPAPDLAAFVLESTRAKVKPPGWYTIRELSDIAGISQGMMTAHLQKLVREGKAEMDHADVPDPVNRVRRVRIFRLKEGTSNGKQPAATNRRR